MRLKLNTWLPIGPLLIPISVPLGSAPRRRGTSPEAVIPSPPCACIRRACIFYSCAWPRQLQLLMLSLETLPTLCCCLHTGTVSWHHFSLSPLPLTVASPEPRKRRTQYTMYSTQSDRSFFSNCKISTRWLG
jgi:hypothetical protein